MPIHHYSWMTADGSATHPGRTPQTEAADATTAESSPAAGSSITDVRSAGAAVAAHPAAGGQTADDNQDTSAASSAGNVPSSTTANKIAAPEPAPRPRIAASASAVAPASLHHSASAPLRNSSIVAMAPLRGSLESLIRQNEKTDADNLERIQTDTDLRERIVSGVLVPVPVSAALEVNSSLPLERRYCRPWTASFLTDLARAHQAQFHHSIEVNSAVRTVDYQMELMRTNSNAAPAEGDVASPHLTGAAIDIAKSGMSRSEIYWMRDRLNGLQNEGKIDVEEEFRQACFHITVYKSYVGQGPLHKPRHHRAVPPADGADSTADSAAAGTPGT